MILRTNIALHTIRKSLSKKKIYSTIHVILIYYDNGKHDYDMDCKKNE